MSKHPRQNVQMIDPGRPIAEAQLQLSKGQEDTIKGGQFEMKGIEEEEELEDTSSRIFARLSAAVDRNLSAGESACSPVLAAAP